jgi:5-methyltetrahydrofolate--homocysteine methyltransferase
MTNGNNLTLEQRFYKEMVLWRGIALLGLARCLRKIGRDQVASYAARKGMSVAEAERWLAPSLDYEP